MMYILWELIPVSHKIAHLQWIVPQDIISLAKTVSVLGYLLVFLCTSVYASVADTNIPVILQTSEDLKAKRNVHRKIFLESVMKACNR